MKYVAGLVGFFETVNSSFVFARIVGGIIDSHIEGCKLRGRCGAARSSRVLLLRARTCWPRIHRRHGCNRYVRLVRPACIDVITYPTEPCRNQNEAFAVHLVLEAGRFSGREVTLMAVAKPEAMPKEVKNQQNPGV